MQQLTFEDAKKLLLTDDIEQLSFTTLLTNITEDELLKQFSPDGVCQIDPRNGNLVIYNSARAKRFHSTYGKPATHSKNEFCPICNGKSSQIFDIVKHSEGFSFVNKNIYPIFHPIDFLPEENADYSLHHGSAHNGRASYGFHLLQWTSSIHERDWHNMPASDALLSFQQLAKLERVLLTQPTDFMSRSITKVDSNDISGYVSIIKNYGAAAGASLSHGHQQIAYSNILPQRFFNNLRFRKHHGKSFSEYMLQENPSNLLVKDYGAALLIVPYFMKRPLDMMLILKDTSKRYLHQLNLSEQQQVSRAIQEATQAIIVLMQEMEIEPAYNIIVDNGPGCGLYLEFLAKTQKMGGYEQIGLFVCQANTEQVATQLRQQILSQN